MKNFVPLEVSIDLKDKFNEDNDGKGLLIDTRINHIIEELEDYQLSSYVVTGVKYCIDNKKDNIMVAKVLVKDDSPLGRLGGLLTIFVNEYEFKDHLEKSLPILERKEEFELCTLVLELLDYIKLNPPKSKRAKKTNALIDVLKENF